MNEATKKTSAEARSILVESLLPALRDELLETHESGAQLRLCAILLDLIAQRMRHGFASGSMISVPNSRLKRFVHELLLPEIVTLARAMQPAPEDVEDEVTLILTHFLEWSAAAILGEQKARMGLLV